ncbi:MAG TPA: pyroglutamyl-peptidase I [Thermomicrobiales bacterium]|nr:pyroglutamyl-peptidase I [Thermomicrobiales bacterium]
MTTILLTGFEPFGGDATNPSWEAVKRVADAWDGPEDLHIAELPVIFHVAGDRLRDLMREYQPDLVIATGLAGGRPQVTPERIAINVDDARIPDNAGNDPIDAAIAEDGPAAYFSTLPIKAAVAAIREQGIPAAVSNSAGTYLCNHIFYAIMHEQAQQYPGARGGFVHIPYSPEMVADRPQPSLALDLTAKAIATIIRTSLVTSGDLALAGGAIS